MLQTLSTVLNRKALLSGTTIALVDQALLSGVNFIIGLMFIKLSTKLDYGVYIQLYSLLLLSQSLQNALATSPLVSLGPKRFARGMQALAAHIFWMQSIASLALAIAAFSGVTIAIGFFELPGLDPHTAFVFSLAIIGQWLHEYSRAYNFLRLLPHHALLTSITYSLVLALILFNGAWFGQFDTFIVFSALATANGCAGALGILTGQLKPFVPHGSPRENLKDTWQLSRWALPGVVVTWGSNYSFVYIVAFVIGVTAAAEISAARLLIMPAALCITAWCNAVGPRISRWVGEADFHALDRVIRSSAALLIGIITAYSMLVLAGYDLLQKYILGEEYAGIAGLVFAWSVYFMVFALRRIGTLCLIGGGLYRELFSYSLITLIINIPIVFLATYLSGTQGAILGLTIAEGINMAMIWLIGWPKLKQRWVDDLKVTDSDV